MPMFSAIPFRASEQGGIDSQGVGHGLVCWCPFRAEAGSIPDASANCDSDSGFGDR